MSADGKGSFQRADAPLDTLLFLSTSAKASLRKLSVWVGALATSFTRVLPKPQQRRDMEAVLC